MAFVVFEGIDGSGKTSLIKRLCQDLEEMGQAYLLTREPGGSKLGDAIRTLLLDPTGEAPVPRAELLLYQASRAQHVEKRIRPALEKDQWVICDRFTGSSVAFQADARGLDASAVEWLNRFATGGLSPDLTVLLDLDPEVARRRREARAQQSGESQDRFEQEQLAFHQKVRASYLRQAQASGNHPWLVLAADRSEAEVHLSLIRHLRGLKWPGF